MNEKENLTQEPQENFATEIFRTFKAHSRMVIIGLLILLAASSMAWAIAYYKNDKEWSTAYYQNDKEWRELFSSYDYISQDGEGVNNINTGQGSNNINTGEQGDLNNTPDAE